MDFKFFFRPEKKKFVLPALLVLMLIYLAASSASLVSVFDRHTCEMAEASRNIMLAEKANNTEEKYRLNKTISDIAEKTASELRTINSIGVAETAIILVGLDPLIPLPCEISQSVFCSTYLTKKSYNCLYNLTYFAKENMENRTIAESIKIRPYSEPTIPLAYNSVILFVEGYLISCLFLGFYRKSKKRE